MNLTYTRRLLAVALLSTGLSGCGYFQTVRTSGEPPTPVVVAIPAPTATAATAAPAPTIAPTAAPAPSASKLPALSDPAWYELARADLDGDGAAERLLYMFSQQVEPRQGFADPYLAGRAMMADVLVIAESDDTIALQLDRTGVRAGDAALWAFPADSVLASFTVAVDSESPFRLIGLPLAASGLQHGEAFVVSWDAAAGAYSVEGIAYDGLTTAPPSDQAAAPLDQQGQTEIATWALDHLHAVAPGKPAAVGALAQAGDYAVAQASVFGEERPRTLYLRHDAGGWNVVLDTTIASVAQLEAAGVPLSLAQSDPRRDVLTAAANHLQDPRGQGVDGSIVIEAFDGSYARLIFVPTNRDLYDTPTLFFAGTQSGWQFVTAGTAFRPEDYDALRIPENMR